MVWKNTTYSPIYRLRLVFCLFLLFSQMSISGWLITNKRIYVEKYFYFYIHCSPKVGYSWTWVWTSPKAQDRARIITGLVTCGRLSFTSSCTKKLSELQQSKAFTFLSFKAYFFQTNYAFRMLQRRSTHWTWAILGPKGTAPGTGDHLDW